MSLKNSFARLQREIGIKKCIILHGNTKDVFLPKMFFLRDELSKLDILDQAIQLDKLLELWFSKNPVNSDYRFINWDSVEGPRAYENKPSDLEELTKFVALKMNNPNAVRHPPSSQSSAITPKDMLIDSTNFVETLRKLLLESVETNDKWAIVINWAAYIFSRGGQDLNEIDRNIMSRLSKIIHDTPSDYHNRSLFTIIVIVDDLPRIPVTFYSQNPEISVINIPKSDADERGMMIEHAFKALEYDKKPLTADLMEQSDKDMLNDFTNREIIQLVLTSKKMAFERRQYDGPGYSFKKIVNLFKHDQVDNPWEKLDRRKIKMAKEKLSERVLGQDNAINRVVEVLKVAQVGLTGAAKKISSALPRGVLFFVGPTGVGKTELAKALAEFIFGDETAYFHFNMSEFASEGAVQKLIGSGPGYVGHDEGGQLTNRLRDRPFCVILFDEIEKAFEDTRSRVYDLFLQILDEGKLTDSSGITVTFGQTLLIFTSNIGYDDVMKGKIAEQWSPERIEKEFKKNVAEYFRKLNRYELLGRIGDANIIPFNFIEDEAIWRSITKAKIKNLIDTIKEKKSVILDVADMDFLANHLLSRVNMSLGARAVVSSVDAVLVPKINDFFYNYDSDAVFRGRRIALTFDGADPATATIRLKLV